MNKGNSKGTPRWFGFGEEVELNSDITVGGRPYAEGTRGVIPHGVKDDTLVELAAAGKQAVEFPGGDIRVIPLSLLRPARDRSAKTRGTAQADPRHCSHTWVHVGFHWDPVDPDRDERHFWSRYECPTCGEEKLDDSDDYYAEDMHIVHLK